MENFQLANAQSCAFLFQKLLNIWHAKADGYYYAAVIKHFMRLVSHPEVLDAPPEKVEQDVP